MKMKSDGRFFMFMKINMAYSVMIFTNIAMAGWALFSKASISKGLNPYIFGVYRQAFATLALAPFAVFPQRKSLAPLSCTVLLKIFFVSFIGMTVAFNLVNLSLAYIPGSYITATGNAIPVMTFLIALFLRVESVSIKEGHGVAKMFGIALCLTGTLVYVFFRGPPIISNITQTEIHRGISIGCRSYEACVKGSFILLSGQAAFAFWLVMQGPLVKLYPDKVRLTTLQCFFSCIQSLIWAVSVERKISAWKLGWDLNLLVVLYCVRGVVYMAITFWLRIWVIERRGPLFAAAFNPLSLLVAVIFSAILWKEIPHSGSICGALLLIGGLYAVLWGKHKEDQTKPAEQVSQTKVEDT